MASTRVPISTSRRHQGQSAAPVGPAEWLGVPGVPGAPTPCVYLKWLKRSGSASKSSRSLRLAEFARCHSSSFWNCGFRVSAAMAGPERYTEQDVHGRGRKEERQRAASQYQCAQQPLWRRRRAPPRRVPPPGPASGPAPPLSSASARRPCGQL